MKLSIGAKTILFGSVVLIFILGGCGIGENDERNTVSSEPAIQNEENSGIPSSPLVDEESLREQNNASSNSFFLPSEESFVSGGGDVSNLTVDNNTYVDLDLVETEPAIVGEEVIVRYGEYAIFFTDEIDSWSFEDSASTLNQQGSVSNVLPEGSKKDKGIVFQAEETGSYVVALKNNDTGMLLEFFVKVI